MQVFAQGLRLLRLSDDYQQAVLVADRLARAVEVPQEGVEAGQEGPFQWERRVALVPVPEELTPGAGPQPRLYALSVAVRWGEQPHARDGEPARGAPGARSTMTSARDDADGRLHAARAAARAGHRGRPARHRVRAALRVGLAAWQRGEERTAKLDRARSLAVLLEHAPGRRLPVPGHDRDRAGARASSSTAGRIGSPSPRSRLRSRWARRSRSPRSAYRRRRRGSRCASRSCPTASRWTGWTPCWWTRTPPRVRFRYLGLEPEAWQDAWDITKEETLPRAVEITLVTGAGARAASRRSPCPIRANQP